MDATRLNRTKQRGSMKILTIASMAVLWASLATAQPVNEVPAYMHIEVADERFEQGDYYNALEQYEEAYKQERDDQLALKIADLHYRLRDFKRAGRWYSRIIRKRREEGTKRR